MNKEITISMTSEKRKEQLRKAQQTFRDKKRIERLLNIKREKELEQSLPDNSIVPDLIPDYNYRCPLGKECKAANYNCELGDKYHKCKFFLLHYPPEPPPASIFKEPTQRERDFYDKLRHPNKYGKVGMQ